MLRHNHLLSHMKELNYIINEDGMCYGLACMGLQAITLGDTKSLKRRLEILAEIPENTLQAAIRGAEERRTEKHHKVKKLLQEEMLLQEKWKMTSDDEKIPFEKKLSPEDQSIYYKELSQRLTKADEELDERDSILLSIPAFFDGIAVYFDPIKYPSLFEKNPNVIFVSPESYLEKKPNPGQIFVTLEKGSLKYKVIHEKEVKNIIIDEEKWQRKVRPDFYKELSSLLEKKQDQIRIFGEDIRDILYDADPILNRNRLPKNQYSTPQVFSRLLPNKLLEENKTDPTLSTISSYQSWTGVYNDKELLDSLKILENEFKEQKIKEPVTLILSNRFHAISVAWEPHSQLWHFIDANEMTQVDQLMDTQTLTSCVQRSLATNGISSAISISTFGHHSIKEPLEKAVETAQSTEAWKLIHSIKDDKRKEDNRNWLFIASLAGDTEKVKLLLESGVKNYESKIKGVTPLHIASQNGHYEIVNLLLKHGASVQEQMYDQRTALSLAAQTGHFNIVKLLLNNPNVKEKRSWYINLPSVDRTTALYSASLNGHVEIVELLLQYKANVNVLHEAGATPLLAAACNGHADVVKVLLQTGEIKDINLKMNEAGSALYFASEFGHTKVVNELLQQKNIDVHTNCIASIPILIEHAEKFHSTLSVNELLKNKGILEHKTLSHFSALHAAAYFGHTEIVKALLSHGANPNIKTEHNISPLELAKAMGHQSICDILNQEILTLKQAKIPIFFEEIKQLIKEEKTSNILIQKKKDLLQKCIDISNTVPDEKSLNKVLELMLCICLQMRSSWDPRNKTKLGTAIRTLLKKSEYAVIADMIKSESMSKIKYRDLRQFVQKGGLEWSTDKSKENILRFFKTDPAKHFDEIEKQLNMLKEKQLLRKEFKSI